MKSVPLKYLASITLGKMLESREVGVGQEVRSYLKASSITESGLEASELQTMPFSRTDITNLSIRENDVLVVEGGSIGRSVYIPQDIPQVHFQNSINRVRPHRGIDGRYLNYAISMRLASGYFHSVTNQATIRHLTAEKLAATPIPILSRAGMSEVADFLDRETGEIDELIRDQASLLKFLDEKIEAQITISISRGLDNYQEAGNHWYPELGAGWKMGQVKSLSLKLTDGAHISPVTENGSYPFVSTKDVKRGKIDTINCLYTDASSAEYMIRTGCKPESGDVLFSKDGTVGESAIVDPHLDFVVASSLVIIRPNPKLITPSFLRMALLARPVREQARAFMKGAGLPRISVANVGRLITPIPPLAEQQRVVSYLDGQIRQADSLREDLLRLIDLARERRAALITAAVTGQIDVTAKAKPAAEQLEDDIAQGLHREN